VQLARAVPNKSVDTAAIDGLRWRRAQAAAGQVVLLSGEPGIGKSRLTAALIERIASEPHARLRYFCSPQHGDSALHPIIGDD
jgi:predicted ATPase